MRPPLLFVHGAFGQAAHFDAWRDHFRALGHQAQAISLPGHGPFDETVLCRARLSDYLAALGDAATQFDQPPVVVGHSLGGMLGLMLAAESELAGLVLVSTPAPGLPPFRAAVMAQALPAMGRILAGRPVKVDPAAMKALATHDLSPAESDEIVVQSGMESGLVLRKVAFANTTVDYEAIRCPVLALSGDKDRLVPAFSLRKVGTATVADVVHYPALGHWLIAGSLTSAVATDVRLWLERHFGR